MKPKLKIFENFSHSILPHEALYLSKLANFQDEGKREIFNKVIHNALHPENIQEFDDTIDKRKYHYIKSWIEDKLYIIDVDKIGNWLLEFKRKLFLDLITPKDEKEMLEFVKTYHKIGFNFQNLYEIMKEYRSYLMIRLRFEDHQVISQFLEKFREAYKKSRDIQEKLYQATIDITEQYTSKNRFPIYWERWLTKVFMTPDINGSNRYKAFILLAFLYNTAGNEKKLQHIFDHIDQFFSHGEMYCRRLLYNYYSSRVLLYSKQNDLKNAIYYGKLSIRQENEDTLMYVNTLASMYFRANAISEAKDLLENYISYYENSHNYYRKITFVSNQLRVFTELRQFQKAENIAKYFLNKYEDEILQYRMHYFFTFYTHLLLHSEKYGEILNLEKKYKLIMNESQRKIKPDYIPNLLWSISLAQYMENQISKEHLIEKISKTIADVKLTKTNANFLRITASLLSQNLPQLTSVFKSYLT
ncbi:hypothetical protein [Chryseobacterium sp. Marseille-Q3244]|uniref:hypothetical protein n=1 Tax=Chryseobacterium sp. Marseille-Q3244 TaxID=2758092 RepID=UPI0020241C94|nr:hypothetical protein [Chryseobacterium sp. Marseille-Q3244]